MLKWLSSLFGKGERQETTIINFRLHRITEKHDQRIREALEAYQNSNGKILCLKYSSAQSPATIIRSLENPELVELVELSYNQLTNLASFDKLRNAKKCFLRLNQLTQLNGIEHMLALEYLDASRNNIQQLPKGFAAAMSNLTVLILRCNSLTILPDDFGAMSNLKTVDLSHNMIVSLPPSFSELTKLEELILTHNNIRVMPSLAKCKNLRKLVLRENHFGADILAMIGTLTSLQELDITSAADLSGEKGNVLGNLTNLTDLRIGNCNITGWPSWLSGLTNLKRLDLSYIKQPKPTESDVKDLVNLEKISLLNAHIMEFPVALLSLPALKVLSLPRLMERSDYPECRLHPTLAIEHYRKRFASGDPAQAPKLSEITPPEGFRPFAHLKDTSTDEHRKVAEELFKSFLEKQPAKPRDLSSITSLKREELLDRILGCLFGNAVGDAIGLSTEFLYKSIAYFYNDAPLEYSQFVRDRHRIRWDDGDWTDDTDQMILIMEELINGGGVPEYTRYGLSIKTWSDNGFPELGDEAGCGLGAHTNKVLSHPEFYRDPFVASEDVWVASNKQSAANGAVMRTSVTGVWKFWEKDTVVQTTSNFAKTTHFDPRCVASALCVALTIRALLTGELNVKDESKTREFLSQLTKETARLTGLDEKYIEEFEQVVQSATLFDLYLDFDPAIGYTFKTLGAGFWALRSGLSFEEALTELVFEGGDADTNGAVAGALLGCKFGFRAIPPRWIAGLCHREWFTERIRKVLDMMGI